MQQRNLAWLLLILSLVLGAVYVVVPGTGIHFSLSDITVDRDFTFVQGLDLQGGIQVLLEADLPPDTPVDPGAMETVKQIIEQRVNRLGVSEPLVQTQGERRERIVVELPGLSEPEQAIQIIKETGLLEFVYLGAQPLPENTIVRTDCQDPTKVDCDAGSAGATQPTPTVAASATLNPTVPAEGTVTPTVEGTEAAAGAATPAAAEGASTPEPTPAPTTEPAGPVYHTVMTGAALRDPRAETDPETGEIGVSFELTGPGSQIFGAFTSQHVNEFLAIVLDKRIISSPSIQSAITGGQGTITGNFTLESANRLALQLRYGALPVPLKVVESRVVGPSLGQDSLTKSLIAGIIGLTVVVLFMALYYRLPGLIAVVAILIYAVITLALFKLIPVTLTLAGIAGFLLSTGSALDANILFFERLKEELRAGRGLQSALKPAWQRAWPSIRDSNIATVIICVILYWFGSSFGASIVKGFAVTLSLGVGVSLFTAWGVTRTLLGTVVEWFKLNEPRPEWFGI